MASSSSGSNNSVSSIIMQMVNMCYNEAIVGSCGNHKSAIFCGLIKMCKPVRRIIQHEVARNTSIDTFTNIELSGVVVVVCVH